MHLGGNRRWVPLRTVRLTSFQKQQMQFSFNLHQVCPSEPSFVFSVFFIHSFYVLRSYFYASLSLVVVPNV